MQHVQVHWHRIFGIYFAVAAACLVAAFFTSATLHFTLLVIAGGLVVAFVPLVMAIYFVRGLRGMG